MKLDIGKRLIEEGCVKLAPKKPFTYASGLVGPIYCDNRKILTHVEFRNKIVLSFVDLVKERNLAFDYIGGIATAGIPHSAFIADRMNMPMIYVRPKPKEHGTKGQVEGDFLANKNVLLVEDLVNQGASLEDAMKGLKLANLNATDCLCIVDYQSTNAKNRLTSLGLKLHSLTNFDFLIKAAIELNFISKDEEKILLDWHNDPKGWSDKNQKD